MAAETNIITTQDCDKVLSVDFVEQFNGQLNYILACLGVTRKMPMNVGSTIKIYKSTVTLAGGAVDEGDIIPLSKVTKKLDSTKEITFDKRRKQTSAEAIQKFGYDWAVTDTDTKFLRELQKNIRTNFFTYLGNAGTEVEADDFQKGLAKAWASVTTVFEDDDAPTVVFVNPNDVADYLGSANVTLQTVFGMTYVTGFVGIAGMFVSSKVPEGTIYATTPDNIVLAYIVPSGEISKAFPFTTAEDGYIGVLHDSVSQRMAIDTVAFSGIELFCENLNGVVAVDISGE